MSSQRILVIGAGRGGAAMLELFLENPLVEIVGIVEANPQAQALEIAENHGIRVFSSLADAIPPSRPCLALNVSGDDSATTYAEAQLGKENVIGGSQALFFWNLVTRLREANEQITYLAQHDNLTGLPNRILFYDRLNQALARARRNKGSVGVLYLDLDGFKPINDKYGHDTGDALLREAAKRVAACLRDSDTVARMGGDEFTVILSDTGALATQGQVANKIIEAISRPFFLNGKECVVSVSIGISHYPNDGETADQLVRIADAAMYLAKNSGKNCYRFAEH